MNFERNMTIFRKKGFQKGGCPQIILKTVRDRAFAQNKLFRYFLVTERFASYHSTLSVIVSEIWPIFGMPKISKNETIQVIVIKLGRKLLHINTMNHAKNRHSRPKNGRLMAIFVTYKNAKNWTDLYFFTQFSPNVFYDYSE